MRCYLASRYSRREELLGYAAELRALGHEVTSRWLLGNHEMSDREVASEAANQERVRFALEDWEDLEAADCGIAFTEPPRSEFSRGGRHVEAGAALAWEKLVYLVGPVENVFYALPQVRRFRSWEECAAVLAKPLDEVTTLRDGVRMTIRVPGGRD